MTQVRQSNIELLRIVAMFMVMMLHVNNTALGLPTTEDAQTAILPTLTRIFFELLSIGSVNVFVLISGWFGIRFSWKSLTTFIFQCVFITWGMLLVMVCFGFVPLTLRNLDVNLFVRSWFVQAYLGLYLLAPALNLLIENNKKRHSQIVIGLFLLELFYDFLPPSEPLFKAGYSTMHFVLLYMIARYVKLYGVFSFVRKWSFCLFLLTVVGGTVVQFIGIQHGIASIFWIGVYSSPVVVFAALCLLLSFLKLNLQNNFVNKVAVASFAVYLLHTNPLVLSDYFMKGAIEIYHNSVGFIYLICICLYMIAWYVLAIVVDFVRQFVWCQLSPLIENLYEKRKLD